MILGDILQRIDFKIQNNCICKKYKKINRLFLISKTNDHEVVKFCVKVFKQEK